MIIVLTTMAMVTLTVNHDDDEGNDEGNLVVLLSVKTSLVLSRQVDNSEIVWRPIL